jgi:hypothetical protein
MALLPSRPGRKLHFAKEKGGGMIKQKYIRAAIALALVFGLALLQSWNVFDCNTMFPDLDRYGLGRICMRPGFSDSTRCPTLSFTIEGGGVIRTPTEPLTADPIILRIQFYVVNPEGRTIYGDLREINFDPGSSATLTANSIVVLPDACCGNYEFGYDFEVDGYSDIQIDHLLLNCQVSTNCNRNRSVNVLPNTLPTPVFHTFGSVSEVSGRISAPYQFATECRADKPSCGCINGCSE